MTKLGLTEILFIIDRSGSMHHIWEDAVGGFNSLIEEQKKVSGEAHISLITFDDKYEPVFYHKPLQEVKKFQEETSIRPRGSTALLDAIGRSINELGQHLSSLPEEERPSTIIVAIMTDGFENASREFSEQQVKDMISLQEKEYNWQFMFLGSDLKVASMGTSLGICSSEAYKSPKQGYLRMSNSIKRTRTTGEKISLERREEELEEQIKKGKR